MSNSASVVVRANVFALEVVKIGRFLDGKAVQIKDADGNRVWLSEGDEYRLNVSLDFEQRA